MAGGQEPDLELSRTITYSYNQVKGWRRWRMLRPCRGMWHDVRRRVPYYWSDITDAMTYRTVASTVRMYFVKSVNSRLLIVALCSVLLPALNKPSG